MRRAALPALIVASIAALAAAFWTQRGGEVESTGRSDSDGGRVGRTETLAAPEANERRAAAAQEPAPEPPPAREPEAEPIQEGETAPVVGFLVDARTGDPLNRYRIEFIAKDPFLPPDVLETDAQGRFQTEREYGTERMVIWIDFLDDRSGLTLEDELRHYTAAKFDEQGDPQAHFGKARWPEWRGEWAAGDPPVRVEREVGPTYRVRLVGAGDRAAHEFAAALVGEPQDRALTPQRSDAIFSRLRSGDPPWVRHRRLDRSLHMSAKRWWMHVVSRDGMRAGHVAVPPTRGVRDEEIVVTLQPTGSVSVRVTTSHELGTDAFQISVLTTNGDVLATRKHPRLVGTRAFTLRHLPPGPCVLSVDAPRHATLRQEFEVIADAEVKVAAKLTASEQLTTIRGTVHSVTGTYTHRPDVVATHRVTGRQRRARVEWRRQDEGGAWHGEFEVTGLDPGVHDVVMDDWDHWRWTPLTHEVDAPAENVQFVAHDSGARSPLRVEVRDADGEPVFGSRVRLRFDGAREFVRGKFGDITEMSAPLDATLEWSVEADGYVTLRGTEAELGTFERGRILPVVLVEDG